MIDNQARIATRAGILYDWTEIATRPDGAEFVRFKHDRPDWCQDAAFAVHQAFDMLPDDVIYRRIRDAAGEMHDNAEASDIDSIGYEWAARAGETYTSDVLAWVASHGSRLSLCDAAAEENGADAETTTERRMILGMIYEAETVWRTLWEFLDERVAEDRAA